MKSYKDCCSIVIQTIDDVIVNESDSSELGVFVCKTEYSVANVQCVFTYRICIGLHAVQCDEGPVALRRHLRARMLFMSGSRRGAEA